MGSVTGSSRIRHRTVVVFDVEKTLELKFTGHRTDDGREEERLKDERKREWVVFSE